jgi:hypothetical protein
VTLRDADILSRPIDALDRAEVVVERFKAAIADGNLEESERLLARLEMFSDASAAVLADREARLGA